VSKRTLHSPEIRWLFAATRLPGILEADEAAALLGVAPHSIPILIGARHLKPLGKPSEKASKKFSSQEILEHSVDRKWQDHAIRMIEAYWMNQNSKKNQKAKPSHLSGPVTPRPLSR
jgi:hypothetical protein